MTQEKIRVGSYERKKPRRQRTEPTTKEPTDGVKIQSVNKEPRRTKAAGVKITSNNNPSQTTDGTGKGVTISKRQA